ncbi:hypothetical protein B1748_11570 [Paenibacillus sp. MY03]|uniref:aldo/keto reductase n=1 Tax=Paenibacillus sp. MY03 TaxID=302980 RepID=UPI000B3C9481|nr:aldo/keto reductase [Paenibacillus sp. MY03]OUS76722.1 hypothetical protein B1748_11570 [Paenibacillus sp. MY03]
MRKLTIEAVSSPVTLSKIILGSTMFGTKIDEKTSFELMDLYAELGGDSIDTASVYGDWHDTGDPVSERTIGKWLKQSGNKNKMKVITKGAHYKLHSPQESRVSAACIQDDIQKSLKSLMVDAIDVYFLHRDNEDVPVSEIMPVLHKHVAEGHFKSIGASNWTVKRMLEANSFAKANHLTPFTVSQLKWSLAVTMAGQQANEVLPEMTDEEYEAYMAAGIPVLAWSSQASGIVPKVVANGWNGISEQLKKKYFNDINVARIENVQDLIKKKGIHATQASLGYITCNRLPAAAIIGPSRTDQLRDSMSAADVELDAEDIQALIRPR